MRNSLSVYPIALSSFVIGLHMAPAFASGREGEAYVAPILWIVGITVVAFVALVVGGCVRGALRARQNGESILKGSAHGLLRGVIAFLILGAASVAGLTMLSILWIAYSFLDVYVLNPH